MKRGLIITHTSTLTNGLKMFTCYVRHAGKDTLLTPRLCKDAAEMVGKVDLSYYGIKWISGPAATKRLAKKLGLEYRKRAPGAGRKAIEECDKKVRVTLWMTRAERTRLKRVAKYWKKSLGVMVSDWSSSHDPDPLTRHKGE